ncbi:MAG: hypothetical protein LC790_05310, partial [Actinobacteria bacterium]|nr:hypothetical protein [Actinomycetota bacterium]
GYLEPDVELVFHEDSYGYRPGRSAHQALWVCDEGCWSYSRRSLRVSQMPRPLGSRGGAGRWRL